LIHHTRDHIAASQLTIHISGDHGRLPASGRKLSLTTSHASSTSCSFVTASPLTSTAAAAAAARRHRVVVAGALGVGEAEGGGDGLLERGRRGGELLDLEVAGHRGPLDDDGGSHGWISLSLSLADWGF